MHESLIAELRAARRGSAELDERVMAVFGVTADLVSAMEPFGHYVGSQLVGRPTQCMDDALALSGENWRAALRSAVDVAESVDRLPLMICAYAVGLMSP